MADKMAFENDNVADDNGERTPNSIVRGGGAKHYPIGPRQRRRTRKIINLTKYKINKREK